MRNLNLTFFLCFSVLSWGQGYENAVRDSIQSKGQVHSNKRVEAYFEANKGNDLESKSIGSVSNGSLQNGKMMPFHGKNFTYFDTLSYFENRAFTNGSVKQIIMDTYDSLSKITDRHFGLMELSNKDGGKMFPHQTHQNGMSVDFMMPLLKDGVPYYGIDSLGADHYWLSFNDRGQYSKDPSIEIDFDLIARHILILNGLAKQFQMKVSKVIIKVEYKPLLFAGAYGALLKSTGIYVVKELSKIVNDIHDEHYHIDFGSL